MNRPRFEKPPDPVPGTSRTYPVRCPGLFFDLLAPDGVVVVRWEAERAGDCRYVARMVVPFTVKGPVSHIRLVALGEVTSWEALRRRIDTEVGERDTLILTEIPSWEITPPPGLYLNPVLLRMIGDQLVNLAPHLEALSLPLGG